MKRTAIFSVLATALLGGAMMVSAADAPKKDDAPKKPVNKFCAVEGKGHDVDPKVTKTYKGKVIGFCCNDCIETFDKDPE
jgi:hypothetical protein